MSASASEPDPDAEPSEREESSEREGMTQSTVNAPVDPPINAFGSLLAILGGWLTVLLLGFLTFPMLVAILPNEFARGEEGQTSALGFAMTLVSYALNGLLGGFVTGRLAGFAPIIHAAVLGAFVGFAGLMSSDAALGMPWWFALGRAVVPGIGIIAGGAVARVVAARRDSAR